MTPTLEGIIDRLFDVVDGFDYSYSIPELLARYSWKPMLSYLGMSGFPETQLSNSLIRPYSEVSM